MAYDGRSCWLCGKNGQRDPLDAHHIFGGAYRERSEEYGLVVYLCHGSCHLFGKKAVHQNRKTMQELWEYGQKKAMTEQGWNIDQFRLNFGKNRLQEDWEPPQPGTGEYEELITEDLPY